MAVTLGKRKRKERCDRCGLWPKLCACSEFPTVHFDTPLFIVRHYKEKWKPTNTVRHLLAMVPSVRLLDYTGGMPPFDPTPLQDETLELRALFPRDDAVELPTDPTDWGRLEIPTGKKLGFVILDGTWHQCSRMSRRLPGVRDLPCVALPPGPPSIYRVRAQHDVRGLCTFEAAVRLWATLEGPDKVAPLQRAFEIVTARMLYQKGKLETPDVPDDWDAALDQLS